MTDKQDIVDKIFELIDEYEDRPIDDVSMALISSGVFLAFQSDSSDEDVEIFLRQSLNIAIEANKQLGEIDGLS